MPLTLLLAKLPAKPLRDGTPRRSIRDRRFEALYAKSFADMRERSESKH
jgi:hypothetical protein